MKTYFFTPIIGLQIQNSIEKEKFIFDDATLMNGQEANDFIAQYANNSNNNLVDLLQHSLGVELAYIVIQREGKVDNALESKAEERALEIIAAISTIILSFTDFREAPARDTELIASPEGKSFYISDNGSGSLKERHYGSQDEHVFFTPHPGLSFSRNELVALLLREPYRSLSEIILCNQPSKFRDNMRASLVNLYRTCNVPSPITQLLGAVTSMEVLLKTEDEQQYRKLRNRLKIMLGDEKYCNLIDSTKVFDLRNKIIHHAGYCNNFNALAAIKAAFYTLVAYSNFVHQFHSPNEVMKFLDVVYELHGVDFFKRGSYSNVFEGWSRKSLGANCPDDLSSHLVYYYSLYRRAEEQTEEKLQDGFALAALIYAEKRSQALSTAFERIIASMYNLSTPFNSVGDMEKYIQQHQTTLLESIETYKRHH